MSEGKPMYSDHPSPELIQLQSKQMDLESGWLGKIFGGNKTAPTNVAGICILLMVITGLVLIFFPSQSFPTSDYWKLIAPLMTLMFGYLFGKSS